MLKQAVPRPAFLSRARQQAVLGPLFFLLTGLPCAAATFSYHVTGGDAQWAEALSSLGLVTAPVEDAEIVVLKPGAAIGDWATRVEHGTFLILEGASPLAESLGFRPTAEQVIVQSVLDSRAPDLAIVWEEAATLARFEIPRNATVFARERWKGAPLLAGFRKGSGAVLWVATGLGERGYSRFPYIPQALSDLGFTPAFRSSRLWAFFDSAYRARVDLDYFAPRWRKAGIAALHVAAWHYWERDPQGDAFLRKLIEACHRNAIQVYAWVELPHVSERFWDQHPEWREKTAVGQDAKLDWRKLINLTNRDAFRSVATGLQDLLTEFDWDGVNLAELYFESLEGYENPSRFTPLNADVRAEFQATHGFDPLRLFEPGSTLPMRTFLEYRAELARRQQTEWIGEIERLRVRKPWLDLVLTHVDDRFDPTIRDKTGADASKTLPLLDQHDFTFLVEDPATLWNLGPQRYPEIASRYKPLTRHADKLAIDINVVERYQDVYPTKQQTGLELFQLVHTASEAFPRVALYFENSILPADLPLLPASAATVTAASRSGDSFNVESHDGVGVVWNGDATVDGRLWPVANATTIWLAAGTHTIAPSRTPPPIRMTDLNAELLSAAVIPGGLEFTYRSAARAMALFDASIARVTIDGVEARPDHAGAAILLPRGEHKITILRDTRSEQ